MTTTRNLRIEADGVDIFYREAGNVNAPVVLLLHGFPSSSQQYLKLIPLLAQKYRVVAPDIPGFGFTGVPDARKYEYKFASFANTIGAFLDALKITSFAVYIFDYGAPTALRLALQRPQDVKAIIAQNGNAYEEGLGAEFWAPLYKYWASSAEEDREFLRVNALSYDATKAQYEYGTTADRIDRIPPESPWLSYSNMSTTEKQNIQLDIFKDYGTNLKQYPLFQEYFRKSQVPLLAVYGKNDIIFPPVGAEAYKKDLPNAEVHLLDAGHFAVETHYEEIAELILAFFKKNGI